MSRTLAASWLLGMFLLPAAAHGTVANTPHNLSASGPGEVRASAEGEVCVFCHVPHTSSATRGLWSRDLPPMVYNLYASSTLEARLGQPTGASRLCLSCHDGTTAPANPRRSSTSARLSPGPLTGRASLGTDLSDDHPVSFVYDAGLALRQGQLVDPAVLPRALPLDRTGQLQCTTCHDPHQDRNRKFLRMDDRAAALCTVCHQLRNWRGSAHAMSPASWRRTGADPWPGSPYMMMSENGCESCHRPHAAPHPPRLLGSAQERAVCLVCHNGGVAARNLEPEFLKPSAHPILLTDWTHDPREDPRTMPRHVACADCHNPHQAVFTSASPPGVPGRLQGVRGVNLSGGTVGEAIYEYEVCLKCHGVSDPAITGIVRQDNTRNIRLKINPSNPSYHPVATVGRGATMGGFEPGYSAASLIYCTDCHNNDEWTPTGSGPRGPHGSRYAPILGQEYQANDPSFESYQTYALCYRCHNRDYVINDRAHTFPHRRHVRDQNASCAACHDVHGSRRNVRLINFMLRDGTGKTVVSPARNQGRLEYLSLGPGRGECYLQCHGRNHEPESYP